MSADSSSLPRYGVLLQVKDIGHVRAFYRDVLNLGDPLLDSNYYAEFATPGGGLLVLQQCDYANEDKGSDTAWLFFAEDPEPILKRLESKGVAPVQPPRAVPGRRCVTFADPEGNLFTVYSRLPA